MTTVAYEKIVDALLYLGVLTQHDDVDEQMGRIQQVVIDEFGITVTQTAVYTIDMEKEEGSDEDSGDEDPLVDTPIGPI